MSETDITRTTCLKELTVPLCANPPKRNIYTGFIKLNRDIYFLKGSLLEEGWVYIDISEIFGEI